MQDCYYNNIAAAAGSRRVLAGAVHIVSDY